MWLYPIIGPTLLDAIRADLTYVDVHTTDGVDGVNRDRGFSGRRDSRAARRT
jgi:hypothetical protein